MLLHLPPCMAEGYDSEEQHTKRDEEDDEGKAALAPKSVLCAAGKVAAGVDPDQADDGDPGGPEAPLWMWGQLNAYTRHDERELHTPAEHERNKHGSLQMASDGHPELPKG